MQNNSLFCSILKVGMERLFRSRACWSSSCFTMPLGVSHLSSFIFHTKSPNRSIVDLVSDTMDSRNQARKNMSIISITLIPFPDSPECSLQPSHGHHLTRTQSLFPPAYQTARAPTSTLQSCDSTWLDPQNEEREASMSSVLYFREMVKTQVL
jgi:hypothetical protein